MTHAADKILPESDCELGAYISTLEPRPANNGNEAIAARGEAIFKHGMPEAMFPPASSVTVRKVRVLANIRASAGSLTSI